MVAIDILKIRFIQVLRLIKEIGLLRTLVLAIFLIFITLLICQSVKQANNSKIVSILSGLVILLIHASRKDKRFIKINFKLSYFIFLVEYLVISFPVLLICCIFNEWENFIILFLFCLLIPRIYLNLGLNNVSSGLKLLLNPFGSNFSLKLNIPMPVNNPKAFEIISGIRKNFIFIILIYLFFLTFSFKAYIGPAGIVILAIFFSGFYYIGESRDFIGLFSSNYKLFIVQKIKICLKYSVILFVPVVIMTLIFQPSTWYFLIAAIILAIGSQIITIIFKYALFTENADLSHNGIIVFINVICMLLPFLWPLPIIMGIRYYFKGLKKLKYYLNDSC